MDFEFQEGHDFHEPGLDAPAADALSSTPPSARGSVMVCGFPSLLALSQLY